MSTFQFFGSSTFGVFNSFSISPTIATRTLNAESPRLVEHHDAFRRDVSREPFSRYADAWLANRRAYIKPNTYRSYRQYIEMLTRFFDDLPIGEFDVGKVRSYQRWRQDTAGALRNNSEVSALQQILREADQWKFIADVYRPLPVPKTKVRQNMSEEEERRLVAVALDSGKPRRLLAGHCLILMANTSMGFGELRHLRREDVLLDRDMPEVTVNGGTKNDYRIRAIPLNFLALRSMRWILKRWESLGGTEPDQYILPHHARRTPDQQAGNLAALVPKDLVVAVGIEGRVYINQIHAAVRHLCKVFEIVTAINNSSVEHWRGQHFRVGASGHRAVGRHRTKSRSRPTTTSFWNLRKPHSLG